MSRNQMIAPLPLTQDLVLIGGGHAHALVLRRWGMRPMAGVRVTVINPGPTAPYTGMLPGFVAGHYGRDDLEIDLVRLARFAGARLILGWATGLDLDAREVLVEDTLLGARRIGYDAASLDVGIHSDMPALPGFREHGLPAKPLGRFASGWADHLARLRTDPDLASGGLAVIGGGVGGVELSMAMAHGAQQAAGRPVGVTLIERDQILQGLSPRTVQTLRTHMAQQGVTLIEKAEVDRLTATHVHLKDERDIPAALVTGAAGARPHGWVSQIGLAHRAGFVTVDDKLRSITDPQVFAVGDCADMAFAPRPKAGVFAVRQAPILDANLRAALGNGVWKSYRPQSDYLKLISLGGRAALADKSGMRIAGAALWRLKDHIDRKFMRQLDTLPAMAQPAVPAQAADGLRDMIGDQHPCGGCGAKVGQAALTAALAKLEAPSRSDVIQAAGDDAAVLRMGQTTQVLTTDQLRPLTLDPRLMTRIAINHALGDCLAMGAVPQAALMQVTLPRLSPALEARTLAEILDETQRSLAGIGAALVGGHSATGPELAIGFTITGLLDGPAKMLGNAQSGDVLILTKPLGTGVVMAADMALQAKGEWVIDAYRSMAAGAAAPILPQARAMTDVTGFGLWGHLMAMLRASNCRATIRLADIPLLPGALELAARGVRSTLMPANRAQAKEAVLPDGTETDLLFDPQTAGGYLAALPPDMAQDALARLQSDGHPAACIGEITDGPPQIVVV